MVVVVLLLLRLLGDHGGDGGSGRNIGAIIRIEAKIEKQSAKNHSEATPPSETPDPAVWTLDCIGI